jgi:hypothetical protein
MIKSVDVKSEADSSDDSDLSVSIMVKIVSDDPMTWLSMLRRLPSLHPLLFGNRSEAPLVIDTHAGACKSRPIHRPKLNSDGAMINCAPR